MSDSKFLIITLASILLLSSLTGCPVNAAVLIINSYDPVTAAGETYAVDGVLNNEGNYGDTVAVIGGGVTSGDTINVYWDIVSAAGLLNSTTGDPDGSFEIWFDVPSDVIGNHYIWIKDVETGQTVKHAVAYVVSPLIKLDITEGLPDDEIEISGYGYDDDEVITVTWAGGAIDTSPSVVESDDDGYWTAKIDVPSAAGYATFTIAATDAVAGGANAAAETFDVGAAITLDVIEGPAGTLVTISGRGFTAAAVLDAKTAGMVEMDTATPSGSVQLVAEDDDTVTISAGETFTYTVIVPSVMIGDYEITVDDGARDASATFKVLGESTIVVEPFYGPPGSQIMVYGFNFTAIAGTTIEFTLGTTSLSDSITVDADGSFNGALQLPALSINQLHLLEAVDENGMSASTDVLIGLITMLLSEYQGYADDEIQLSATGLRGTGLADDEYDLLFGDVTIYSGVPTSHAFAESFVVPDVPPGTYEVTLIDHGWGISVSTEFQVIREISNEYWYLDLHVQTGQDYSDITCGVIQSGTQEFDESLGDQVSIPAPPEGVFAYFNSVNAPNVVIDTSKLSSNFHGPDYPNNWTFEVELIGVSGETTISWNSLDVQSVPAGYSVILITPDGYLDMQSVNEYSWIGVKNEDYSFKVFVSEIQTQTLSLTAGWNLVSYSLELLTPSPDMILGHLEYYQAYTWNGASYEMVDSFEVGVGYWILVLEDAQVEVSGYSLGSYTYVLEPGWSLIGCYDIASVDLDAHLSGYYQLASWDGHGYDVSSSIIQPFKGYWVLVIERTELTLP